MVENGAVDMENDVHKFCVSFISCQVAYVGLKRFVESWNHHTIPGRCCYECRPLRMCCVD